MELHSAHWIVFLPKIIENEVGGHGGTSKPIELEVRTIDTENPR